MDPQSPILNLPLQQPGAATVAGDFQLHGCAEGRIHVAKGVRQSANEAIEDRMIKLRCHDAGTISGEANLLLVMPALGEFASGVEPVEGSGFTRRAHVEYGGSKGVERFMEVGALAAGRFHNLDQNRRTETTVNRDALVIQTIDQVNDTLRRSNG